MFDALLYSIYCCSSLVSRYSVYASDFLLTDTTILIVVQSGLIFLFYDHTLLVGEYQIKCVWRVVSSVVSGLGHMLGKEGAPDCFHEEGAWVVAINW